MQINGTRGGPSPAQLRTMEALRAKDGAIRAAVYTPSGAMHVTTPTHAYVVIPSGRILITRERRRGHSPR